MSQGLTYIEGIKLTNTLTRKKELFKPINEEEVRIYSCGPTVYSEPHIGNFRAFFLADILRATLRYIGGYCVKQIMNITDVGHLTDENNDAGEDKMEKGARKLGKSVREVAKKYEDNFFKYLDAFNIEPFDKYPRATDHIDEQIEMVKTLIDKGYTYEIAGDGIYMDTSKVEDYGKLAQLDIEGLSSQHREEGTMIDASEKCSITDFALWKYSPKDKQRAMERLFDGNDAGALLVDKKLHAPENREGKIRERNSLSDDEKKTRGFPGWHVECSAMASKYLGKQFDIHTGGIDHIPVHHTNEIAQSECCFGVSPWVNYWIHQQFLNFEGGKMSKSKGHDLSVPGIVEKGYSALDLRYFFLTAQYNSFLDFSFKAIESAQTTRNNIIKKLSEYIAKNGGVEEFEKQLDNYLSNIKRYSVGKAYKEMAKAMSDDLNTPACLSLLHTYMHELNDKIVYDILIFDKQILKVGIFEGIKQLQKQKEIEIPASIQKLAVERDQAKENNNYKKADALREEIRELGWEIMDTSDGRKLEPK